MYIFINGHIKPIQQPAILANDRGFLLGDGLFETIRSEEKQLLFFSEHYIRLLESAQSLGIYCHYSEEGLKEACKQVLHENKLHESIAALRITLTRGKSDRGINLPSHDDSTLVITASQYHDDKSFKPDICLTDIVRNEYSKTIYMKSLQYMDPILCRKYAKEKSFSDGLMKNTKGAITEASVANIFFIIEDTIVTPKLEDGIFPGIKRQTILDICKDNNLPLVERTITPSEINNVDHAFLTNSLVEIQPINSLESNKMKKSKKSLELLDTIDRLYKTKKKSTTLLSYK